MVATKAGFRPPAFGRLQTVEKRWSFAVVGLLACLVSGTLTRNAFAADPPSTAADPSASEISPPLTSEVPRLPPLSPSNDSPQTLPQPNPRFLGRPVETAPNPLPFPELLPAPTGILRTPVDPPSGFAGPSGVLPTELQVDSDFVPVEDRWRIGFPEWDRYDKGHPPLDD